MEFFSSFSLRDSSSLRSIFFLYQKKDFQTTPPPNIIMWQFEDGKPNSGIWKNMLPTDPITLKKAMSQGEKSTTIKNRFGTFSLRILASYI